MAVTLVDAGVTDVSVAASTWTLTAPSGLAAGEVLLISVVSATGALTMSSAPSGATLQTTATGGSMTGWVYVYVTPSTPPGSLSWTLSASDVGSIAWARFDGVDTGTPVDAGIGLAPASGTTTATTWAPASITTVTNGAYVAGGVNIASGSRTITDPTGFTAQANGTQRIGHLATKGVQSVAGATGTASSFTASGAALRGFAFQIALRPASGPTAAGTMSLDGTATATGAATAAGTLTLSGTATATAAATAAGVLTLSGSATPLGSGNGTAAGTMALTGAAAGTGAGVAAGVLALTGAATGLGYATAAGALTLAGTATAKAAALAAGVMALSGSATGAALNAPPLPVKGKLTPLPIPGTMTAPTPHGTMAAPAPRSTLTPPTHPGTMTPPTTHADMEGP